jgi:major membrane immunogen (membrane-anchored lipoprotein)
LQQEIANLQTKIHLNELSIQEIAESKEEESGMSNGKITKLESELREAKGEIEKKVSDTSQFQQMMKLMKSQTTKIKDLRQRLEKYEPSENCKDDD